MDNEELIGLALSTAASAGSAKSELLSTRNATDEGVKILHARAREALLETIQQAAATLSALDEIKNRPTYKASELRVVNNNTRDFMGGYSVETRDGSVVAGPYAVKITATEAKADLVAGRPVQSAG